MDSRFRIRFWSSRRVKSSPAELDLHSVPYQTAPAADKQPVFIHQSLGRNLSEKRRKETVSPLQALSYRQVKSGKSPLVGGRPHKGNGPVKLQTSRRLSSGELLVTSQDSRRTLEEIREGEYIVGVKDRRDSKTLSIRSPSVSQRQQHMSPSSASAPSFSPNQQQVPPLATWTSTPGTFALLDIPEHTVEAALTPRSAQSAPASSQIPNEFGPNALVIDGLGLIGTTLEPPSARHGILKSSASSPISLLEPHEERNATIRALWKAEYGRLVSLYGQAGVDRNIAELKQDQGSPPEEGLSPIVLDPLPQPGLDLMDGTNLPRSSRNSRHEPTQHEDVSDESSHQRLSFISSVGYASSYTTRTSFAETDSINTRDDIRKVVDDMRSTYLRAIEAREPSPQAVKSLKKKKKNRTSTTPSSTPRTSTAFAPAIPSTPEPQERRSISLNPSPPLRSSRNTRNFSSPVGGINKLPAIEASPSRGRDPDVGLKRADSSTLGALMGEHKRMSIQKRRSKRHSRRTSTQHQSPQKTSPSKGILKQEPDDSKDLDVTALGDEFQNLYNDIFRTSTYEFWETQPGLTPTISSPTRPPPPVPT